MSFLSAQMYAAAYRGVDEGELRPLLPESDEVEESIDSRQWLIEQWKATVKFESKGPIPLHVAAMGVGAVACAVGDRVTYYESRPQSSFNALNPPQAHYYSWYHVMVAVVLFDVLYIMTWIRNSTPRTSPFNQVMHGFIVSSVAMSQVLCFGRLVGEYSGSWTQVCSPVIVATVFLAVQYQWPALLGLTAIGAAFKADGVVFWDWALVFSPIWLLVSLVISLAWLLPNTEPGEDPSWTKFKKWFWLLQTIAEYGSAMILVIKMDIGTTATMVDNVRVDWFPYRTIVAVWLLPVTCVVILAMIAL